MIRSTDDKPFDDGDRTTEANCYAYDELDGTDLQYHQARHFDPTVGRCINQDPIGYEGW
jgi:RHS repeat-associated protein